MKKETLKKFKPTLYVIIFGIIISFFIRIAGIKGNSMSPTLKDGDIAIVYTKFREINRGDIISFNSNLRIGEKELENLNIFIRWKMGEYKKLLKRVIAVEGDSITITKGDVILNGTKINEEYINGVETTGFVKIEKIPAGKVFVMGDNRAKSVDSRSAFVGLVDIEDIIGKVVMKVYLFSEIEIFK